MSILAFRAMPARLGAALLGLLAAGIFTAGGAEAPKAKAPEGKGKASKETEALIVSSEIEGRRVIVPPDLPMDLEWYSPQVGGSAGKIVRGWVKKELILLETDKNNLICIRRKNGTEKWRAVLSKPIRYEPAVSRNNVVLNVNNVLVAIEKRTGEIRWRLLPKFVMSEAPLVIDPPAYPADYTAHWQNMESIYVGSWKGRIHAMTVRGRMREYVPGSGLSAVQFGLFYPWHRTHNARGIIRTPLRLVEDLIYYTGDDRRVYAVSRDGKTRAPYVMQGEPVTNTTVTANNVYVGASDFFVYAMDRLTLSKKWAYAMGAPAWGTIFADEPGLKTFVYVPSEKVGVHALLVHRTRGGARGTLRLPESFEFAWKRPAAQGIVSASEHLVYLGYEKEKGFPGYRKVAAVDKETGKVRWKSASQGVRFYLEFHNAWRRDDQRQRLFAITADNRLLSFKEKAAGYGPLVKKVAPKKKTTPKTIKVPKK